MTPEEELAAALVRISELEAANADLTTDNADLRADLAEARSDMKTLKTEMGELINKLRSYNERKDKVFLQEQTITALRKEVTDAFAEITRLQEAVISLGGVIRNLNVVPAPPNGPPPAELDQKQRRSMPDDFLPVRRPYDPSRPTTG